MNSITPAILLLSIAVLIYILHNYFDLRNHASQPVTDHSNRQHRNTYYIQGYVNKRKFIKAPGKHHMETRAEDETIPFRTTIKVDIPEDFNSDDLMHTIFDAAQDRICEQHTCKPEEIAWGMPPTLLDSSLIPPAPAVENTDNKTE